MQNEIKNTSCSEMLDEIMRILEGFARESVELLRQYHVEAGQRASGDAYEGFDYELAKLDTGIRLIISGSEHLYFLEHGRGSGGFPPPDKIKQWIHDKGLAGQFDKEYKLNSFAYAIGKRMSEEGSYLHRTGETQEGFSNPIGRAFEEARLTELADRLGYILNTEIRSDVLKEII